jgi:hypothetical protein
MMWSWQRPAKRREWKLIVSGLLVDQSMACLTATARRRRAKRTLLKLASMKLDLWLRALVETGFGAVYLFVCKAGAGLRALPTSLEPTWSVKPKRSGDDRQSDDLQHSVSVELFGRGRQTSAATRRSDLAWATEWKQRQAEFKLENIRFVHDVNWNKRFFSLQAARDGGHWFWQATHTIVVFGGLSV